MSVFDQFLYPRHCRAQRLKRPDGSCCRSLPALPHPLPNSLQIPGMPAPPKSSPGQRQGWELGLGALPVTLLTTSTNSWLSSPPQQQHFPNKSRDPWVSSAKGGMCRPQNPQPSPKEPASSRAACSRQAGLLPIIPTTCPRPPGCCHTMLSSGFHPRLLPLIPVPAAGHRGSLSPSQNPGACLSPGQVKGKAPDDCKEIHPGSVLAIHTGSLASGSSPAQNIPWRSGKAHAPRAILPAPLQPHSLGEERGKPTMPRKEPC